MSWPTDRRPSDALTGELVPEVWSAKGIQHVKSYLPCIEVVDVDWRVMLAKGDVLHIPVFTTLTASVVDPTVTAAINSSNVQTTFTTTAETLTIDKWYEVPIQVDDSTKKQTSVPRLLEGRLDSAMYAIEKVMDTDVNGLFSTLNGSSVYGSDGQTFNDDILIALMEILDEADVQRENRSLVGDPSVLADCYKIDKFMSFDYTSRPLGAQGNGGYRGTINQYNLPVYITNNLTAATTGSYGVLIHREAIGLAIQDPMDVEYDRVPAAASDLIYCRMLWGADELRDSFGVPFYTRKA